MSRVTVYEKNTCSTCRELSKLLRDKGIEYDSVQYVLEGIPRPRLEALLRKMNARARDLVRTKEPEYRDLGLADAGDEALIEAMVRHPSLIQRPIVEIGDRAVLARPPVRVREIL